MSSTHSQGPTACPYPQPHKSSLKIILVLFSHVPPGLSNRLFSPGFPLILQTKPSRKISIRGSIRVLHLIKQIIRDHFCLLFDVARINQIYFNFFLLH